MQIDARWAWLLAGRDKIGVGVQSNADLAQLDHFNPSKVLFLDPEFHWAAHYGERAALRTYHGDKLWWKDAAAWAEHGANNLAVVYPLGVRDYVPINEVWALEGLSDDEEAYRWMGQEWTPAFLDALENQLAARYIPLWPAPGGVRVWLYGPSPGHNYEDNLVGLRYLAPGFRDPRVFGSIEHYYYEPTDGFIGQPGFLWHLGRMLTVRQQMLALGIDKPVWVGEWNRRVDRNDPNDIARYAQEFKQYHRWLNSLPWVVWATIFLWSCGDWASDFYDLTVTRTPGLPEMLSDGWDRRSEGEWAAAPEPTPQTTEGEQTTVVDKDQILASIDTLWGVANDLDAKADALKVEAERIRAYVVAIKQAAGLEGSDESPKD